MNRDSIFSRRRNSIMTANVEILVKKERRASLLDSFSNLLKRRRSSKSVVPSTMRSCLKSSSATVLSDVISSADCDTLSTMDYSSSSCMKKKKNTKVRFSSKQTVAYYYNKPTNQQHHDDLWWSPEHLEERKRHGGEKFIRDASSLAYMKECRRVFKRVQAATCYLQQQSISLGKDCQYGKKKLNVEALLTNDIRMGMTTFAYRGLESLTLTRKTRAKLIVKSIVEQAQQIPKQQQQQQDNGSDRLAIFAQQATETDAYWALLMAVGDEQVVTGLEKRPEGRKQRTIHSSSMPPKTSSSSSSSSLSSSVPITLKRCSRANSLVEIWNNKSKHLTFLFSPPQNTKEHSRHEYKSYIEKYYFIQLASRSSTFTKFQKLPTWYDGSVLAQQLLFCMYNVMVRFRSTWKHILFKLWS